LVRDWGRFWHSIDSALRGGCVIREASVLSGNPVDIADNWLIGVRALAEARPAASYARSMCLRSVMESDPVSSGVFD
jgi:hypothetical protein